MSMVSERLASVRNRLEVASGPRGKLRVVETFLRGRAGGVSDPIAIPLRSLGGSDIWVRPGTTDLVNVADQHMLEIYLPAPEVRQQDLRVIWELGSNMGGALTGLAHAYPRATLVGVEPDPGNYAIALRNVERYGDRVSVVNAAVWDSSAELIVDDAHGGGAHGLIVRERSAADPSELPAMQAFSIPDLFEKHLGADDEIDYMHVTIEGTEPRAFAAPGWAERVRSLRVEAHPYFGYTAEDCVSQLEGLGYRAWPDPALPDKWVHAVRR